MITHTGRGSGAIYRTPLEAHSVDGGYAFVLMYGSDRSDWVKNVLAAGQATLTINGTDHHLTNPRIGTGNQAWDWVPGDYRRPPSFLNVTEVLFMDLDRRHDTEDWKRHRNANQDSPQFNRAVWGGAGKKIGEIRSDGTRKPHSNLHP